MTISSAAAVAIVGATAQATLSVTATAVNDLWVVYVSVDDAVLHCTGVSGGNAANWTEVEPAWADGGWGTTFQSIWIGTMTSTGVGTITATYSGSVAAVFCEIDAHPFHSNLPNPIWVVDGHSHQQNASSATVSFPTLAPLGNNKDLYYGVGREGSAVSTPLPSGFVTNGLARPGNNAELYSVGVTGSVSPTLTQTTAGTNGTQAVLISDASLNSLVVQQNAVNRASTW